MNSIYTNADPALLKLFEQAGHLRKVLCAPLDFAKKTHTALFCNGLGDVLKKRFHFPNSTQGVEELLREVAATCKHRGIKPKHVFFGGEDTPSYADNFTAELRRRGFVVARVNAFDAKKQREKLQASTDGLDLHGIAHCLLKGRARVLASAPEIHSPLRLLVREREFWVHLLTAVHNRLHPHVDRLFPGFLDEQKSGLKPYGPACCWLMEDRFSAPQIARRSLNKLVEGLEKHRLPKAQAVATQLQALAAATLAPQSALVVPSQLSVQWLLQLAQVLRQNIADLDQAIAVVLAKSPAARLTTVPGLGLVLSAGLGAELFLMGQIPGLDRICCYAGIIPATEQTGGPEQPAYYKKTFPHCNLRLKNYLLQAGEHMARIPGSDASALRQQAEAKGRHTERILGKHAAGVVRALLLNERAYLPQRLYQPDSRPEERGAYFEQYWPKLRAKWGGLVRLELLFAPNQPLGRWRLMVQQAYNIRLALPGSNSNEQPQRKDLSTKDSNTQLEDSSELI